MNQYYDDISPMIGICLYLDPILKKGFLEEELNWLDDWIKSVDTNFEESYSFYKKKLRKEKETREGVPVSSGITPMEESDIDLYIAYKRRKMGNSCEEEMKRYLNSPREMEGTDVLGFWKAHSASYPILSVMAKDYLTVQASSVSAERAFSSGVDLVTPNRTRLSGKTIEMTQFLKHHL